MFKVYKSKMKSKMKIKVREYHAFSFQTSGMAMSRGKKHNLLEMAMFDFNLTIVVQKNEV